MSRMDVAPAPGGRAPDRLREAVAGIAGAVAYTLFVEVVNVAANGAGAFFRPFRQIGAVVLGPRALDDGYDLVTAVAAGTLVHLLVAAAFGVLVARARTRLRASTVGRSAALGLAAGLAFYAVDVFAIFPAAFPWFLANDRLTQATGHALFGAVTGAWLAWRARPAPRP